MKKILIVLGFIVCVNSAFAQFSAGIKGGINFTTFSDASSEQSIPIGEYKVKSGFNAGLFGAWEANESFGILTELTYVNKGYRFAGDDGGSSGQINLNYITLVFAAKYDVAKWFSVFLGPEVGYLVSAANSSNNNNAIFTNNYSRLDLGLAPGLMFNISRDLSFDVRYVYGLLYPINETIFFTDDGINQREFKFRTRNQMLQLNLSYTIFGK